MSLLDNCKVLIIVPAFNEAGNIGRVVKELHALQKSWDIIVVDDGSSDATGEEARAAGAMVVSLPVNLGIGGAVQTGFCYAYDKSYDVAVQVDGDGQHDPASVVDLLKPLYAAKADIVIGSRFLEGSQGFQSTFGRRIGINFFARLIHALTGVGITDPTSGLRAYNRAMIELFAQYYPQDFPEPEAVVVAQQAGARICEVSVVMRKRDSGQSSIGRVKSLYYMLKVTFAILLRMIRRGKKGA